MMKSKSIKPQKHILPIMANIARFKELKAGTTAPAYVDEKIIGNPLIPLELDIFISDPEFCDSLLWWVPYYNTETKELSCEGHFTFALSLRICGFGFHCKYDLVNKVFIKLNTFFDDFDFDLSKKQLTVDQLKELLGFSDLEMFKYVKSNLTLNKRTAKNVDKYIARMESYENK